MATPTIKSIVDRQVAKTLKKGDRLGRFDQIRQRHFWSTYLFVVEPSTSKIAAGTYDLFKTIPGAAGQGYPTNVNLSMRETNWLNAGRVPDNQNIAILEVGATIKTPPLEASASQLASGSLFGYLPEATKTYLGPGLNRGLPIQDAWNIANGTVLEMTYLTNSVPLGLLSDFSQSGGIVSPSNNTWGTTSGQNGVVAPVNGLPAAPFRRKLGVPITLSAGENMGMRLSVPRDIELLRVSNLPGGEGPGFSPFGKGWYEVRVDWWAIESFVEKS